MICVSVMERSKEDTLAALTDLEFAEVRLEAMNPTPEDARQIFSLPKRLIATMRPGSHSDEERLAVLAAAIGAGATYVDVELGSTTLFMEGIAHAARKSGCEIIISHHDLQGTPESDELGRIVNDCFEAGADIAKIACVVKTPSDAARLLGILDDERPILTVGMGELGRITRVAAPLLGSPFTFASPTPGKETAPGQIDAATLARITEELKG